MLLYLIRHAEPEGAVGRCLGHTDLALSAAGRSAVGALAEGWRAPPTRVVASDLARTRETAAVLAARWALPVRTEPRLREMHFGVWDGRLWDAVRADDADRLDAWGAAWSTVPAPEGESFAAVAERVGAWWEEERSSLDAGDRVAVVAHAGSLRALLCHLLELPLDRAFQFRMDYARVTALSLDGPRPELRLLNADRLPVTGPPVGG